jgi:phosphoribosylglycinamide formyltransferase-1
VTPALDAGPAILQRRVPVLPGDSAASLAERVLEVEHLALVEVLAELSASMTAGSPAPIRARR